MLGKLILQNEISCAFTSYVSEFDEQLTFIPIIQEEVVLGVPVFLRPDQSTSGIFEELPLADLSDFKESSFIMTEPPSALHDAVNPLFEQADFRPLSVFSSPNVVLCESMIRAGAGVGILPASYVKNTSDILYFRLRQTAYLHSGILCQKNHHFSIAERFLFFLQLQQDARLNPLAVEWSNPWITDIAQEFSHMHYFKDYKEKSE